MKIQIQTIDLLKPWPTLRLADGYHAMQVRVRIGAELIGEVETRAVRKGQLTPRRLSRRIARRLGPQILRSLTRQAVAAGPESLANLSLQAAESVRNVSFARASWRLGRELLEKHLLLPGGLPHPWPQLIAAGQDNRPAYPLPAVSVVVCTRDRHEQLDRCIQSLQRLDYPQYQILIVDNSSNPEPTRQACVARGVTYLREAGTGLSRARNAALNAVSTRWVAFTDDDCLPEPNWLRELVRKLQDTNCRCVCGLVLPAQLENSAEIAFEIYGGLGRGYADRVFAHTFIQGQRWNPAETWRIGAGANMLLDAALARELGGFDEDLGAGTACGCSEDTLLWYQILRSGRSIHYTPRAVVHHYHRSSPEALRKQIYNYAVGHAAYHVRCLFSYGDYRSLLHLVYHLPTWFWRNYRRAARGRTKYPRSIIPIEATGTLHGIVLYPLVKLRRLFRSAAARLSGAHRPQNTPAPSVIAPPANNIQRAPTEYESVAGPESIRAA